MNKPPRVLLTRKTLDVPAAIEAAGGGGVGGVNMFLGVTRAEAALAMGGLVALEYHAYEEMALSEMNKLMAQANDRWAVLHAVLWHRLGVVKVGEVSVVAVVGCAHRNHAFEACQFLIDELKKTVPIWKKEIFPEDARWQSQSR